MSSNWEPVEGASCQKCGKDDIEFMERESSCGGYDDYKYRCRACGHSWWVDGPDA